MSALSLSFPDQPQTITVATLMKSRTEEAGAAPPETRVSVSLVVSNYPPEIGSAARIFAELSRGLAENGFDVAVVTTFARKGYATASSTAADAVEHSPQSPRIARVHTLTAGQTNIYGRALEHFILGLSLPLKAMRLPSDVILVYSPPLPLAVGTVLLARVQGARAIVNVQDLYPQTALDAGMIKSGLPARLLESMASWIYRHADLVVTHSEGNAEVVIANGARRSRVKVIHNWADQAVESRVANEANRHMEGNAKSFLVLYAGIMSYHQDLETLIRAAALLKDDESVRFVLIGDGPAKTSLQLLLTELSASNVVLMPAQPPPEYAASLASADIAVVMLRKEVSTPVVPSKLFDIMASGVCCIAVVPHASDAARIVSETGCGVVVEPGSPGSLAGAIQNLKGRPEAIREMAQAGRRAYIESYSFRKALKIYSHVIGDVLNESN